MRFVLLWLCVFLSPAVVVSVGCSQAASSTGTVKLAEVERRDLVVTISATGTLEPVDAIDVGAQVAGKIQEFGKEPDSDKPVDYRSEVEAGAVLAKIDSAIYQQEVELAKAQLAKAKARQQQAHAGVKASEASVARAEADLAQLRVKLVHAERDFQRARRLSESKVVTQEQFDAAQANVDTAQAAIVSGEAALTETKNAVFTAEAAVEEAKADVQSADASLRRAELNLEYTTIRSPIKGVIIDRRVNIGQTVVASLNAPSLFLIAKDLSRLQVWAAVNEADIGRLQAGQPVTFTVDAFPGEKFTGEVQQIRLNASMTQNVVTYTVVVNVDNERNRLLPYLTANVKFEVARHATVLAVPNSALNWRPRPEQLSVEFRDKPLPKSAVWVQRGELFAPISVKQGDTDGQFTIVESEELSEGLRVAVGENRRTTQESVNPLLPQVQGKKKS